MTTAAHPARAHLIAFGKRHPGVWRQADDIRARMADSWPAWCYLPVPGWAVALGGGRAALITDATAVIDSGVAAALGAWRITQGIYQFDPDLYAALIATPITGEVPAEVLCHLPEWCVYIETPTLAYGAEGRSAAVRGAWVHLDHGHKTSQTKLRVVLDAGDSPTDLIPLGCPLVGTLEASLDAALAASALGIGQHGQAMPDLRAGARGIASTLAPLVSLALYLCDAEADVGDGTTRPSLPRPKRTRDGWRLFPADKPMAWEVGVRVGAALRATQAAGQAPGAETGPAGARRPHVRRAHWHTYRTGAGRAEQRVRWLAPIRVNVIDSEDLPAVVRRVQED